MRTNNGMNMQKPTFDSLQVCVEVPTELRDSLLNEGDMVTVQDSLLDDRDFDTSNIVIKPISKEKMEEIARRVSGDLHMLPYHIIQESMVSPCLNAEEIRNLDSRIIDFIFAEIYKINGFQCLQ